MHRLFVAIRPPAAHRAQLLALMGGVAGARWQRDDQLHLTLRFIGEVDRHRASDIADALRTIRFAPFDARIAGVGVFDRRGLIDTLWAGVQPRDPLPACIARSIAPASPWVSHPKSAPIGRTSPSPASGEAALSWTPSWLPTLR